MSKPNIVQIVADDLGYGDLGAFNSNRTRTPNIDRLTAEGVCFDQHYSGSPVCAPARACLLTGRYPQRTGVFDTRELRGYCNLALSELTIADVLKGTGYVTGLVGKWHNGSVGRRFHPNARGFDEFVGFRTAAMNYFKWNIERNGTFERSDGSYLTDFLGQEAAAFIQRHRHKPFYLHLAFNAPHTPLEAPEKDIEHYRRLGQYTEAVCRLYAMIERLDTAVGLVRNTIRTAGIENNTIVQFTSDNGPDFSGTGDWSQVRFNCGLSGSKFFVYEGGIRVPMILRWPDGIAQAGNIHETTHFADWLPTFAQIAGTRSPQDRTIDGVDLGPLLKGQEFNAPSSRCWQWNRYEPLLTTNAAIRKGPWKLVRPALPESMKVIGNDSELDARIREDLSAHYIPIRSPSPDRSIPAPLPPILFDIENDPAEHSDIAEAHSQRVAELSDELTSWFNDVENDRSKVQIWPSEIE